MKESSKVAAGLALMADIMVRNDYKISYRRAAEIAANELCDDEREEEELATFIFHRRLETD